MFNLNSSDFGALLWNYSGVGIAVLGIEGNRVFFFLFSLENYCVLAWKELKPEKFVHSAPITE